MANEVTESLQPVPPSVANVHWNHLDENEKERLNTLRNVVCNYNGVFRFSDDNQMLFCKVCQYELPYNGLETLVDDVNKHVAGREHVSSLSSYIKKESEGLNKVLATAISDGVFFQVYDGVVRCLICGKMLNDSLANLKRHLFSEQHRFGDVGLPYDQYSYRDPYGPAARKLFNLVGSTAELEFTTTTTGLLKVKCNKCNQLLRRDHHEVQRHMRSKRHTKEKRKPRAPNKSKSSGDQELILLTEDEEEDEAETDGSLDGDSASEPLPQPTVPRARKSTATEPTAAISTVPAQAVPNANEGQLILVQSAPPATSAVPINDPPQFQPIYVIQGTQLQLAGQPANPTQQSTWNGALITSLNDLVNSNS